MRADIMKKMFEAIGMQWTRVRHYAGQETLHIAADRNILLVVVLAPLVYSLIFGLTYYNGKLFDLPVAVVDYDHGDLSRTLIRNLESNESLTVTAILDDESRLRDLMVSEQCWAAVVFPRDMEKNIKRGELVQVPMIVNTSNIIIGNYAQKGIQTVLGSASAGISMEKMMKRGTPGFAVRTSYSPVDLQVRTVFNVASNYALFVLPLLLMLLLHQVIALGAGMSWAKAMGEGIAPFPSDRREMHAAIIGRVLPYAGLAFFWFVVTLTATLTLLEIPFVGSLWLATVFGILAAIVVALLGSLTGVLVRDKLGVVQMLFFTSMPILLISGGSWPIESMPAVVRAFALLLPSTHIMMSFRQQALEGIGISGMVSVFGILLAFAAALYTAVALAVRRRVVPG
jgi:ABC-2 type transport system permease protein